LAFSYRFKVYQRRTFRYEGDVQGRLGKETMEKSYSLASVMASEQMRLWLWASGHREAEWMAIKVCMHKDNEELSSTTRKSSLG
jgi:hypothetical protein